MRMIRILVFIASISLASVMHADTITFTNTFVASGTLGASSFSNALVTLVGTGDAADFLTSLPNFYRDTAVSTTITVAGLGSGSVITPLGFFLDARPGITGKAGATVAGTGFQIDVMEATAFQSYDSHSSFAPVPALLTFSWVGQNQFNTSLGAFIISDVTYHSAASFGVQITPSPVPEPSSLLLMGSGTVALLGMVKRRFRSL